MHSYFLFTPNLSNGFRGSYSDCINFGDELVKNHSYPLLKIARARAGETDARIIFDITPESRKQFAGFRAVKRKTITRVCKQKPFDI